MKKINLLLYTILCLSATTLKAQFSDLHDFNGSTGEYPYGSLTLSGNMLYGMAESGGLNGWGCIFSIHTDGSEYKDLWDFNDTGSDGNANGEDPYGSLLLVGKRLYGMTAFAGGNDYGVVFSIDTNGSGYKDLLDFDENSYPQGATPFGSFINSGSKLFGMTRDGGANGQGVIFSLDTDGSHYKKVFDFDEISGINPYGALTLSGDKLFGMTIGGGTNVMGNIFSIDTNGNGYKNLWSFKDSGINGNANGDNPYGSLTLLGKKLYGMTNLGGANNDGTVFSIDTTGSGYKDLLDFNNMSSPEGRYPEGSLTPSGGLLYGMTENGGPDGYGVVFSIDTDGSGYNDLINFTGLANGSEPYYTDLVVSGNTFYGMTNNGGAHYVGLIFSNSSCTLNATANDTANISCYGANDGNAIAHITGGTSPYSYSWSNGGSTALSTSNPTGTILSAGTYTVTVQDNSGCTATATATITQPASALGISMLTHTDVNCYGGTGTATANAATGGTSPYTYSWSSNGGTDLSASNLSVGTYTITVTDNHSCTATALITITQPSSALGITMSTHTDAFCNGSTGTATARAATGGTSPYTYSWSPNGGANLSASNLSAGTYTITVTDNHSCTATASVSVTQPLATTEISMFAHTDVLCNGGTGAATANDATGGTSPYTYSWSPNGGSNLSASNLSAGTYTITATDNSGCGSTASVTITQPGSISVLRDSVADKGSNSGIAGVTVSGGTSPYTYSWAPGGQTTDSIKGQSAGTYTCTIKDNNGCTYTTSVTVILSTGIEGVDKLSSINIYPDPNSGYFTITGLIQGQIIELYNYMGQKMSSTVADNSTMHFDISTKANGIYLLRLLNKDGIMVTQTRIVKVGQ